MMTDFDLATHDPEGRDRLIAALEPLGIDYELFACDPALADTAAFCAAYGFAPEDSANTILVIGKSDPPRYAACVVLATGAGLDAEPEDQLAAGADREEVLDEPAFGIAPVDEPGRGVEHLAEQRQPDRCLVVRGRVQHRPLGDG